MGLTLRQIKADIMGNFPQARKVGDERPYEELTPEEQQEIDEATEAAKAAFLEEGGMQLLFHCGHCDETWVPGEDEELVSCEVTAEVDGVPSHFVCWDCREGGVPCPTPKAN